MKNNQFWTNQIPNLKLCKLYIHQSVVTNIKLVRIHRKSQIITIEIYIGLVKKNKWTKRKCRGTYIQNQVNKRKKNNFLYFLDNSLK